MAPLCPCSSRMLRSPDARPAPHAGRLATSPMIGVGDEALYPRRCRKIEERRGRDHLAEAPTDAAPGRPSFMVDGRRCRPACGPLPGSPGSGPRVLAILLRQVQRRLPQRLVQPAVAAEAFDHVRPARPGGEE